MNNSKLVLDTIDLSIEQKPDHTALLREKETKNARVIEALQEVQKTKGWSSLKEDIFDPLTKRLKSELYTEAKKEHPDTLKLNRIAGQIEWAERYSDLSKLENVLRVELTNIKKLLHGNSES